MPAHWRLAAVVQRLFGRQTLRNEISGVVEHGGEATISQVRAILWPETEAAPERGALELREDDIEFAHLP